MTQWHWSWPLPILAAPVPQNFSMTNGLSKMGLLTALSVAMACVSLAQVPASATPSPCGNDHKVIAPRNPRTGTDGDILPGQRIVQLKFPLGENATLSVVEYPRSSKEAKSYNSTIIVRRGHERKEYALTRLIKYGSGLRLVELASFCSAPDSGTVFLAFETPSIGAAEGFVVIRYSSDRIKVQALPIVDQGRIVVTKAEPNKVELWSATGRASAIDCDACNKYYVIQSCEVGKSAVTCNRQPGPAKIRSPSKFIDARIEVR
jgi:hypothetical protein